MLGVKHEVEPTSEGFQITLEARGSLACARRQLKKNPPDFSHFSEEFAFLTFREVGFSMSIFPGSNDVIRRHVAREPLEPNRSCFLKDGSSDRKNGRWKDPFPGESDD